MSDNLTQKLKRELEKRGQVASDAQIEEAIALYRQRKTTPSLTSFEGIQTAEPETNNLDLLNAVGVGLYTALDTATFGATGLVCKSFSLNKFVLSLSVKNCLYSGWTNPFR